MYSEQKGCFDVEMPNKYKIGQKVFRVRTRTENVSIQHLIIKKIFIEQSEKGFSISYRCSVFDEFLNKMLKENATISEREIIPTLGSANERKIYQQQYIKKYMR